MPETQLKLRKVVIGHSGIKAVTSCVIEGLDDPTEVLMKAAVEVVTSSQAPELDLDEISSQVAGITGTGRRQTILDAIRQAASEGRLTCVKKGRKHYYKTPF